MNRFKKDIAALIFFLGVVAIFFAPTITKGLLPVPSDALVGLYHPWRDMLADKFPRGVPFKNFLITDPVRQEIPWRKIAIDDWKKGQMPRWNPYSFSGTTLVGNIQAGVFYPLNILFFFLPFSTAWTVLIMLEPLLAGLFLYLFLRHKQLSVPASLLGAISWSFSGFSVAWLTWGTIVHVALWLPLILLSLDKLFGSYRWLIVFVAAAVSQFFAGHVQISLYVLLVTVAYALWQKRANHWLARGVFLFVVTTSIQWIPLLHAAFDSNRLAEATVWNIPGWFLPWPHLVQYVAPDFFGNPATMNYFGVWNYGEFIGYIGITGLIFAGFALYLWKRAEIRFWIAVLGIAGVFLLPTPIARLPYDLSIPFLSALQPTRLTMVVDFALAILAAYGFDAWQKTKGKQMRYVFAGLGIILAVLWGVAISQNVQVSQRNLIVPTVVSFAVFFVTIFNVRSLATVLLLLIAAFDLVRFGIKFTPFAPVSYFFPITKTIEFLQSQPGPFRVVSLNKEIMPPNTSAMYGIESIEGYDPIVNVRYEEYFAALARGRPDISKPFGFNRILTTDRVDSPLLPLFNVRYVLSLTDRNEQHLRKIFKEGETRVYEDLRTLPRAYLAEKVDVVSDKQKILDHMYDPAFNTQTTAIVEQPVHVLSIPMTSDETATITSYQSSSVEISVRTLNSRLLVIANVWNKNWYAMIDGKAAPLLRVNYVFQGVVVPEGKHIVRLQYGMLAI